MLYLSKQGREGKEHRIGGCPVPVIDALGWFRQRMAEQDNVRRDFLRGMGIDVAADRRCGEGE